MPALSIIIIATIYFSMSSITFIAFALDKRAARRNNWRTPEATLHTLELLGGWPGALLGQRFLRHKSSKTSYRVTLWCIIALHIFGWCAWWWMTKR